MTIATQITVKQFKDGLPLVPIMISGKKLYGRTSGRLNNFCTVSVTNSGKLHSQSHLFADYHFSWESVTRAYNSDSPLTV